MNKKIFSVLLVTVLTASYVQAQFTLGARAGLNLTNVFGKYDGTKDKFFNPKYKPGFQIGIIGEYGIRDNFAIQSGILFATQRYKYESALLTTVGPNGEIMSTVNIDYLQIPVNAQYKIDLGGSALLLQAGPYFGFALGGKIRSEYTSEGQTVDKNKYNLNFGNKDFQLSPFDFGLGMGVGLKLNAIQIGLGYNLGLANVENIEKKTRTNRCFAITATYFFRK